MNRFCRLVCPAIAVVFLCAAYGQQEKPKRHSTEELLAGFEAKLEQLRELMKIPAFSAAIVKDQKILWAKGFGCADLENRIEATPNTPYHLASLTKIFASAVIMQQVEQGLVGLDDPVSNYGINIKSQGIVRVKHLMSHTSEDPPGSFYRYNGDRFSRLDLVVGKAAGKPFRLVLQERIIEPLGLTDTAPNSDKVNFAQVHARLAQPYRLDESYEVVKGEYPEHFSTAAGLISSVVDIAKFDAALDNNVLIEAGTRELAFTPMISTTGETLPYGLGWFSQEYMEIRLIWHYGYWQCNSSLILKVPETRMTFIILANTDALSRFFPIGASDTLVLVSPVAMQFLKTFVLADKFGDEIPEIDWAGKEESINEKLLRIANQDLRELFHTELMSYWSIFNGTGKKDMANMLLRIRSRQFGPGVVEELGRMRLLAKLDHVGNDQDLSADFVLEREAIIRIFAQGEGLRDELYDYAWIENAETGEVVWQMAMSETGHAGGTEKNRKADKTISLAAGKYRLRYKSDDSHSFDDWNSYPPVYNFWGIAIYSSADGQAF
jgi:CubicO group peptidase (beta-lactamase class C family)